MKRWTLASILLAMVGSGSLGAQEVVWIDVASQQDYAHEHLVDAVHIPYTHIARHVSANFPDKTTAIQLYDRDEHRALQAQEALQTLGYEKVANRGDLAGLKAHGQATVQSESSLFDVDADADTHIATQGAQAKLSSQDEPPLPRAQPLSFTAPLPETLANAPDRED